jgi:hypothetical protein
LVFVFLAAAFLVGFVAVFLERGLRLAADADFVFCLELLARFFLVKPEAAPPRPPRMAPATAPPRALPATPLASSAASTISPFAVAMTPSLLPIKEISLVQDICQKDAQ